MTAAASGFTGLTGEHSSGPHSRPGLAELSCLVVLWEVLVVELGTPQPVHWLLLCHGGPEGKTCCPNNRPCSSLRSAQDHTAGSYCLFPKAELLFNFCSTNETPHPSSQLFCGWS